MAPFPPLAGAGLGAQVVTSRAVILVPQQGDRDVGCCTEPVETS